MIRPVLLAAALAASLAPAAQAGGLAATVVEPVVIVEAPPQPRSSLGVALPLVILAILVAVAVSRDDEEEEPDFQVSDARLKTDVLRVGTSPSGLPIYRYSYLGAPGTFEGVMAQDLVTLRPDAVVDGPLGLMMVDYGRLDVDFRRVD